VHVFGTESTGTLDTIVFLWSWYFLCVFFMLCAQVNIMFLMLLWVCILNSLPDHGTVPKYHALEHTTHSNIYPKGRGFDSHRGQGNDSACPVWIHTQSNIIETLCSPEYIT
jgi:hypothetical protein